MHFNRLFFFLIFFIFSCGRPSPEKNSLPEQPECSTVENGEEVIAVRVEADGSVLIGGQKTTLEMIGKCAANMKENNPQIRATITGEFNTPHENIIELMETFKANGITKIVLKIAEN